MSEKKEENIPQKKSYALPIAIVVAGILMSGAYIYVNESKKTAGSSSGQPTSLKEIRKMKYIAVSDELGLDKEKFKLCYEKYDTSEIVNDSKDAASYGINGTPGFVLGVKEGNQVKGIVISGAMPFENFKTTIEELLGGKDINTLVQEQNADIQPRRAEYRKQIEAQYAAQIEQMVQQELAAQPGGSASEVRERKINEVVNDQVPEVVLVTANLDDDPSRGNKDAKVVLLEFSDYECPYCKKFSTEIFPNIKKDYVDTNKIFYVFRDLPLSFHEPVASEEAVAANCAREQGGDDAYYKYHDYIYENTQSNKSGLIAE